MGLLTALRCATACPAGAARASEQNRILEEQLSSTTDRIAKLCMASVELRQKIATGVLTEMTKRYARYASRRRAVAQANAARSAALTRVAEIRSAPTDAGDNLARAFALGAGFALHLSSAATVRAEVLAGSRRARFRLVSRPCAVIVSHSVLRSRVSRTGVTMLRSADLPIHAVSAAPSSLSTTSFLPAHTAPPGRSAEDVAGAATLADRSRWPPPLRPRPAA